MKNRLASILREASGRTVMLAIDHGGFQGPTTRLERVDLDIVPIAHHADALMLTRGMLRSTIPRRTAAGSCSEQAAVRPFWEISRRSTSPSISMMRFRLKADCVAVQVFVGSERESQPVRNMTRLVDAGYRAGIPGAGRDGSRSRELTGDVRYLGLAVRFCAELGARVVKTYYSDEGFERVVAGCPVPVVMAGGKKVPEREALELAYRAIQEGAAGVDMGRNIFQSASFEAMIQAVISVDQGCLKPNEALDLYRDAAGRERADSKPGTPASR